ncbi:MAG: Gfo/Idh/MocA family oxidoreductase [Clostridia bacterium]|nr:Gfo/Idh/MocA family oxidoreductase [Clostridia bacterium]
MFRVAIIGLGVIAPLHLNFLLNRADIELCAACDLDPAKASLVPESTAFYTDYAQMLDEVKPDVVHVCLPHYLHTIVSEAAAQRGIAVFCEKPLSTNYEGAKALASYEEKYGVKIGICLQNRLNACTVKLLELAQSGQYGKVLGIKGRVDWYRALSYYEAAPWRGTIAEAGSGAILNQAVHTLDIMTLFHDEDPVFVRGAMLHISGYPIEVEDTAVAQFDYADGCRCFFSATVINHSNEPIEVSVVLEQASLIIRGTRLYLVQNGQETMIQEDQLPEGEKFYYGAGHNICMTQYYAALEANTDLYIHPQDAMPAMRIFEAMRMSQERNGEAVAIEELAR